jgi:hypothetical protein
MSRALELARNRTERPIRIVSGSATDPSNKGTLERTPNVVFHATVNPDNVLTAALFKQFADMNWPLGLLHEANTQYGRQFLAHITDTNPKLRVVRLPFPMNVSRLRATIEQKSDDANALGLPLTMRPLPMEEKENPEDKIPEFFPNTASAYIALSLTRMLETLRQDKVKSVAIMATDPRDKLYLAQQLALHRPDVSILTAEADSIYLHPDYSSYMQGALVASTYPLYGELQHWTYGVSGYESQREFANDSAQGIYNAALALLDYDQSASNDEPYAPAAPIGHPPALIEYGTPGEACFPVCGPPMWLSVVGRSSTLPMRATPYDRRQDEWKKTGPYVFEVQVPAAQPSTSAVKPAAFAPFPSPTLDAAFLVSGVAILWYCAFARRVRRAEDKAIRHGSHGAQLRGLSRDPNAPGRGAFLAVIAGVLAIETFAAIICFARVRVDDMALATIVPALAPIVLALACSFALLHLSYPVAATFLRNDLAQGRLLRRAQRWWMQPAGWAVLGLAVVVVPAVLSLLAYEGQLLRGSAMHPSFALGLIARAADPMSGVCPTLPVVMLAMTVVFWGGVELARTRAPQVALAQAETAKLVSPIIHGAIDGLNSHWELFERSILAVPWRLGLVAAMSAAAVCTFSFDPWFWPLTTVEGTAFGQFVSAMQILLEVMVSLALLQFVCLWLSLRHLLERMAWHPIAVAFDRVPRELFPRGLLVRVPKLLELQPLVAFWDAKFSTAQTTLTSQFDSDMRDLSILTWTDAKTWRELRDHLSVRVPVSAPRPQLAVAAAGLESVTVNVSTTPPPTSSTAPSQPPATDAPTPHGDLVAMSMTLVLRDALARLWYNLVFVVGAVLIVFSSHVVFPFRQHQSLAVLDWIFIGLTFTTIIVVLVQMKHDDIIGRLTAKVSGERTTWDAEFILKLAVFGLLPLLTLFAAQFPEIGGTLVQWLAPVEKALP